MLVYWHSFIVNSFTQAASPLCIKPTDNFITFLSCVCFCTFNVYTCNVILFKQIKHYICHTNYSILFCSSKHSWNMIMRLDSAAELTSNQAELNSNLWKALSVQLAAESSTLNTVSGFRFPFLILKHLSLIFNHLNNYYFPFSSFVYF